MVDVSTTEAREFAYDGVSNAGLGQDGLFVVLHGASLHIPVAIPICTDRGDRPLANVSNGRYESGVVMCPMERVEPFVDSTQLLAAPEQLRQRAAQDGYLFFRRLIAPSLVMSLREQTLLLCERHGFLDPTAPRGLGQARKGPPLVGSTLKHGPYYEFYRDLLRQRFFQSFVHTPALISVFEILFGERVLPHMRTIGRVVFPQALAYTTAPHQDHVYIRGTTETWTCWVPMGDCPEELGPVAVLRGSHRAGLKPIEGAFSVGGQRLDLPGDVPWVSGPFEAGDVACFHSLTFHQGRDNRTEDRLRLSLDCRLQPASQRVDPSSQRPHLDFCTREEVVADWPDNDLVKQYWLAQSI